MSQIVIAFLEGEPPVFFLESPKGALARTQATLQPIPARDQPTEMGQALIQALAAQPALHTELEHARQNGQLYPILLVTDATGADALPWEQVYDPDLDGFLALSERFPLARAVSDVAFQEQPPIPFQPPLRIAAVLSAAHVDAIPELNALHEAIQTAQIPIELLVVSGDEAVKDHAEALGYAGAFVPPNGPDLMELLLAHEPQVLHFFCHGVADLGTASLEIATRPHFEGVPDDQDGVRTWLEARDFRIEEPARRPWLVTLSACNGARPYPGASSLARGIVSRGVPAVVGMREPITPAHSRTFASGFFTQVIRVVEAALAHGGRVRLDFAQALRQPRMALARAAAPGPLSTAASTSTQWTLPVLYTQRSELVVDLVSAAANEKDILILKRLEEFLNEQGPTMPIDGLTELVARIEEYRQRIEGGP